MTKRLIAAVLTAGAVFAGAGSAIAGVVYHPTTGHALGIADFSFMGTTYDVSFLSGSYVDVYGTDTPIFLGDEGNATAARAQIGNVLNAEPTVPVISDGASEVLWLPVATAAGEFVAKQLGHGDLADPWGFYNNFAGSTNIDFSGPPNSWLFAKFGDPGSLTTPAVPLPGAGLLLLGGLGGLAIARRRRKA